MPGSHGLRDSELQFLLPATLSCQISTLLTPSPPSCFHSQVCFHDEASPDIFFKNSNFILSTHFLSPLPTFVFHNAYHLIYYILHKCRVLTTGPPQNSHIVHLLWKFPKTKICLVCSLTHQKKRLGQHLAKVYTQKCPINKQPQPASSTILPTYSALKNLCSNQSAWHTHSPS